MVVQPFLLIYGDDEHVDAALPEQAPGRCTSAARFSRPLP